MYSLKIKKRRGLTLLEVVIAIGIIGIVVMSIFMQYNTVVANNQIKTFERNCQLIQTAVEMYRNDHAGKLPQAGVSLDAYIAGGLRSLNGDPNGATYTLNYYIENDSCTVKCIFKDAKGVSHENKLEFS